MESANATTTMTLGVVEDYPIQLGPIKIFLQIQVVEEAPFEVLLGRPFFNVISCSEVSTPGSNHKIQVKDPKDQTTYIFTTQPCLKKCSSESRAAANFC